MKSTSKRKYWIVGILASAGIISKFLDYGITAGWESLNYIFYGFLFISMLLIYWFFYARRMKSWSKILLPWIMVNLISLFIFIITGREAMDLIFAASGIIGILVMFTRIISMENEDHNRNQS
jgi:hypothetical protein